MWQAPGDGQAELEGDRQVPAGDAELYTMI